MGEPVVKVSNLKKHFRIGSWSLFRRKIPILRAVDGVTLSIQPGETLALVGESGSGKTTLANLVLRLELPTEGQVIVNGQDIHAIRNKALKRYRSMVQAVFQDPASSLNPRMRIGDIIAEPMLVNRSATRVEVERRVGELLREMGLKPEHAKLYPHEFSGGQRQRIALASALATKPQLIVLDEPVSALDVSIRAQIVNLLIDVQAATRVSYLLISHELATVRYMAHWTAVMYLGKIVEHARTDELFANPLHPYTQGLLAAWLPVQLDAVEEKSTLGEEIPSPINPPSGCRLHPRCPHVMPNCSTEQPKPRNAAARPESPDAADHIVACHLY